MEEITSLPNSRALRNTIPLSHIGVTRVANLTELDRIGVPVWQAIRPNARTLSVSSGKGLSHDDAQYGAILEACEAAIAENARALVSVFGTIEELNAKGHELVCQTDLPQVTSLPDPLRKRAWVSGRSLVTGAPALAPYELVGLDFRIDAPWDRSSFRMSSTGLAAGHDRERTLIHALLETIEDEAIGQADLFGGLRTISAPSDSSAALGEVIRLCETASLLIDFKAAPNRFDIPVVLCTIRDIKRGGVTYSDGGTAAATDLTAACLAALLEAVQNRSVYISGARDDLAEGHYFGRRNRAIALTQREVGPVSPEIFDANLQRRAADIVARLLDRGCRDAWLFDLPTGMEGLIVGRVLVAGLGGDCGTRGDVTATDLAALLRRKRTV